MMSVVEELVDINLKTKLKGILDHSQIEQSNEMADEVCEVKL